MKYVKLTAKPDTWFKSGTEVYDYDSHGRDKIRVTLESYLDWAHLDSILVRGTRVCNDNPNENGIGCEVGEEREDGELCDINEFFMEETEEKYVT